MKRGLVAFNPFADVVIERRIASRDRVLTDDELKVVWRAACDQPYPFGPAVQLMILKLQRLSEVTGMAWSELAPDFSRWTIPAVRAKNRRAHVVHLSAPAREILQELHARRKAVAANAPIRRASDAAADTAGPQEAAEPDIDLIFTVTGVTPVSRVGKARRALDPVKKQPDGTDAAVPAQTLAQVATKERAPKVERARTDWRFHDFRRTGVSKMAELGIPPHVADRVLNHVSGAISGVAAVYQRFEFLPERARALDVWAAHVLALGASESTDSNVLSMSNTLDRLKGSTS
jgi:integrase